LKHIAADEKQPWIQSSDLLVECRPDNPFDDDDDPDYVYTTEVEDDEADNDSYFYNELDSDETTLSAENLLYDDTTFHPPPSIPIPDPPIINEADNTTLDTVDTYDTDTDIDNGSVSTVTLPVLVVPPTRYNLRPSRTLTFSHCLDPLMDESDNTKSYLYPTQLIQHLTHQVLTAYILTQMYAAAGIKNFGQPVVDAIFKEFCQLHDKGVFDPPLASQLTPSQKRVSLCAVNLIKEKRSGEFKGRTCAGGSVQLSLFDKANTTSPTVANDALMYTMIIDARESSDVATADVVDAYLNADTDQFTLMKLTGEAVDIMVTLDNKYAAFATQEIGKSTLYLQLKKALYGCVKSALLWYKLFVNTLKDLGFKLNPYDACVANKTIQGTQCTIVWYVDHNTISHINPKAVSDIIGKIE
jgi:hypothetical protein